jgi:hypothetical protein
MIERMFWRPTKKDIIEWLQSKKQEFSQKDNRNPWMKNDQWMQMYVYKELHEIFFGEFSIILTEWLEILVENTGRYRTIVLRNWTLESIRKLNFVSNKTSCTVDFWLNNILGGYIT